jgi:hypothetical protein
MVGLCGARQKAARREMEYTTVLPQWGEERRQIPVFVWCAELLAAIP